MRLGLVDLRDFDYTPLTPYEQPLGGMQSGLGYLAVALSERGHAVTLINRTSTPGVYRGVECVPLARGLQRDRLDQFDAVVSISCAGSVLRRTGVTSPLVLWTGHNVYEPTVQKLKHAAERGSWDRIVLKSDWQLRQYCQQFQIAKERTFILRNAISPCFEQTPRRSSFFFENGRAPVLVYSSTPYRGLAHLLAAFPQIRASLPGCTARIYSSMQVYQLPVDRDIHRGLYEQCRAVEGVEYYGSLNQTELAEAIAECDVLAYPNTYPETSCITLMEAMASGCLVVSNAVGALPETGAGYGYFCRYPGTVSRDDFARIYADFVVKAISRVAENPAAARKRLEDQMVFARTNYCWSKRADQWEAFLQGLVAQSKAKRGTHAKSGNPPDESYLSFVNGLDGKPIYVDLRDERGRRLIKAGGNFNPPTLALWHSLLGEDDWTHVIDVGANYGEMLANGKLPESARVIAVEPNPRVLPYLKKTLANLEGVRLFEVALSNRSGFAPFQVNSSWSGMSRIVREGTIVVPTMTFEALLDAEGTPHRDLRVLAKLDVEGHEIECLMSIQARLDSLSNFVALVEVAHMRDEGMQWILEKFDAFGYNPQTQSLHPVSSLRAEDLKALSLYDQDVVIRRRARDAASDR